MRKAWHVFLAASLAVGPRVVRADNWPASCIPVCEGATLSVTYGGGVPLQTTLAANFTCNPVTNGNGCHWCMSVQTSTFRQSPNYPFAWGSVGGGPYFLPPGPSAQNFPVTSYCNSSFTETFSPQWGAPSSGAWSVTGMVYQGGCAANGLAGGQWQQQVTIFFTVTNGGLPS